jgi:hypothetical protein
MDHSEPIFLQLKILDIYKINDYLNYSMGLKTLKQNV